MMLKRMNRIFNVLFVLLTVFSLVTCVFAGTVEAPSEGDNSNANIDDVLKPLVRITQILLLIGAGVCVGKLLHIGILFVTSSAAERSNAKMAMLPWLIGTFVCFGASAIGSFVIKILSVHKDVLSY